MFTYTFPVNTTVNTASTARIGPCSTETEAALRFERIYGTRPTAAAITTQPWLADL